MIKTHIYRLYPSPKQQLQLDDHFGCCRMIWNLALEVKKTGWNNAKINVSRYDLQKQLLHLKREYYWLYKINSQSLQSVLLHLDHTFNRFFKGGGYPKFKKKSGHQSFQCPQGVRIKDNFIKIPIVKDIKCPQAKALKEKIKTVTIIKTSTGKYFAHAMLESDTISPIKPEQAHSTTIGIDVGIKSFVVTSTGKSFQPNRKLKQTIKRLQCLQRRASRKKKGSANRKKAYKKVALIHERITNQRADYIHKTTTQLIRDNQANTFVIENLNIVGMLQNGKLSQAISDVSFGEFFRQMKYKCDWYGKNLIVIDRFAPSSKRCSDCGNINQNLTLSDREWSCECGATHDRDLNAAKNIKFFGLNTPVGSRGGPVESRRLRRAKKQERIENQLIISKQLNNE